MGVRQGKTPPRSSNNIWNQLDEREKKKWLWGTEIQSSWKATGNRRKGCWEMRRDKILNRFLIHIYMLILGIEEAIICLKLESDPRFAFLERSFLRNGAWHWERSVVVRVISLIYVIFMLGLKGPFWILLRKQNVKRKKVTAIPSNTENDHITICCINWWKQDLEKLTSLKRHDVISILQALWLFVPQATKQFYLSLLLQWRQRKQDLWKLCLSATRHSIG